MSDYGIDPAMLQQLMAFMQANPEYTAKGVAKPVSLTEQAKATNFQQDQMQSLGNPLFAAMLGGGQGFDMSQFADVQDGADTYAVPTSPLDAYATADPNSVEGSIVLGIKKGLTPDEITQTFVKKGLTNTPDDKALDRVRATATDLFNKNHEYQSQVSQLPGFEQGPNGDWQFTGDPQHLVGGKLTVPKMKRSDIATVFDKAGLPTPDKQFSAADFGYDGSQQAGLQDQASQIAALAEQASGAKSDWQGAGGSRTAMNPMLQKAIGPLLAAQRPRGENSASSMASGYGFDTSPVQHHDPTPQTAGRHASSGHQTAPTANESKAYDDYAKLVTQQRKLERQMAADTHVNNVAKRAANGLADLNAQHGLTPLTLAMLQRSQALGQLGA